MFYAVLTIHIMAAIVLVFVVLLQSGRGAELGAAFGGMGQATYGRGQSTFISKLTTGVAVVFMTTSLSLAFMTTEHPDRSVLPSKQVTPAPIQTQTESKPALPSGPAPTQPVEQTSAPLQPKPAAGK
jgi:preprotein translocase subunit SecG